MAKTLTIKTVQQAKAGPVRQELPDRLAPGLRLVVQPSGAKSWAVRYRFRGQPQKLTIGPLTVLAPGEPEPEPTLGAPATLVGARALARKALADAAAGIDPAVAKRAAKARVADDDLFDTVADHFVERYAKPRNRDWKGAERILKNLVKPKWKKRRVQDITRRDVRDLLDGIVRDGKPVAANRTLATIRKLFNWCIERDLLQVNPCAGIKAPTPETSRDRVLSDDELRLIWRGCDAIGQPFGPMMKALILTGQRRDEVAAMEWSELDLAAGMWTLPRSRTKNNEPHTVPLTPEVVDLLKGMPRIAPPAKRGEEPRPPKFVFTTTGAEHVSGYSRASARLHTAILKAMQSDAKDVGADPKKVEPLPRWTWHDLRRTLATGMARMGQPVHVVEAILNHKSGKISGVAAVYNRYQYEPEKRRALEAWAAHVLAVVQGQPAADNVVQLVKN